MKLKFLAYGLLIAGTFLSSCDNDDENSPSTGTLKATVTPSGSATRINVITGTDTVKATPANGIFIVENLRAGEHTVLFTPAATYEQPTAQAVTINAGKTTDMGTVTIAKAASNSMAAKINGTSWNSSFTVATVTGNSFSISGGSLTTGVSFIISNFSGTKTYTSSDISAAVVENSSQNSWVGGSTFSNATVTITNYDTATKKISGTFSFTGVPLPGTNTTGTKTVTEGKFTNVTIQ